MRLRLLSWSALFLLAGAAVAAGWVGSAWPSGPRLGAAMALLTAGFLLAAPPLVGALLRRTARPGDYVGGCPVGATCPCGHFNFKPRRACKACGQPTRYAT